jgi:hypothetical protein
MKLDERNDQFLILGKTLQSFIFYLQSIFKVFCFSVLIKKIRKKLAKSE